MRIIPRRMHFVSALYRGRFAGRRLYGGGGAGNGDAAKPALEVGDLIM
jgi:hypothetical protein